MEAKLKLDRLSGEKQALLEANGSLEKDRDDLRTRLRQTNEENVQIKERFVCTHQREQMFRCVEI